VERCLVSVVNPSIRQALECMESTGQSEANDCFGSKRLLFHVASPKAHIVLHLLRTHANGGCQLSSCRPRCHGQEEVRKVSIGSPFEVQVAQSDQVFISQWIF